MHCVSGGTHKVRLEWLRLVVAVHPLQQFQPYFLRDIIGIGRDLTELAQVPDEVVVVRIVHLFNKASGGYRRTAHCGRVLLTFVPLRLVPIITGHHYKNCTLKLSQYPELSYWLGLPG